MGFGNIGIWQLLIVLGIVVLIFGTGKLRSMGSDVGGAIKSFRKAVGDGQDEKDGADTTPPQLEEKSGSELKQHQRDHEHSS